LPLRWNLINIHDPFQVETIGDAYLVVSGAPKRNGDRHVVEICDMALDIIEVITIAYLSMFKFRLIIAPV